MQQNRVIDLVIPEPFRELFAPSKKWRHLLYHGGRASGKSTQVGTSILVRCGYERKRVLCGREFQNSMRESVHQLLRDLIGKYNFPHWVIHDESIKNRKTGSEIYFKGLHNNTQTIKSFEAVDLVWVEEAQSVSLDSIDTLIPTVRKSGSQIIWTMNRLTAEDPVWLRIAKEPDERTLIKKVNSTDIEQLLSEEVILEREKMRAENPELFEHVWLGEPLTAKTGSVFGKQLAEARESGRIGGVPYDGSGGVYTAWDLGVSDSTVIWFFQNINGYINFIDYYEGSGEDLGYYISILRNKNYNYITHFLPHDARNRELQSGKSRVQFFADNGVTNVEVLRPTSFKLDQNDIDLIARPKFTLCRFDEEKCARGLDCLRAYHYAYDERNKLLRDRPEHDWSSHASSAFIYAMIAVAERVVGQRQNIRVVRSRSSNINKIY